MRKRLIAGNWKMNMQYNEAMTLVAELADLEKSNQWSGVDVAIIPPVVYTRSTFEFLKNAGSDLILGVQDVAATENGAFTGEVSAAMACGAGAEMALVGHSERRMYFKESNQTLLEKLQRCLDHKLVPVLCCGEQLEERTANRHFDIINDQLSETVFRLDPEEFSKVVIAYEPVWAIGTGETATPEQAQEVHAYIRECVSSKYGQKIAGQTRILYGGSMKPDNAGALISQPDIDGGLIGGASLKADQFRGIIEA